MKKTNTNPCYSFIKNGSKCSNGMVRCCGILNCMRQYPTLQYTYYDVHKLTNSSDETKKYEELFKEATDGISFQEYHLKFWGKRFFKRKDGTIDIEE
ncbi:MAG: hypothetical protein WC934_02835 [Acidithiobacillus sp.]|jgi:hypothetical protein|uniref:hypothetical protein n=1 Tax=Acidithiobacillus sp. TaxID=1872118 RepID=UPI00355E0FD2